MRKSPGIETRPRVDPAVRRHVERVRRMAHRQGLVLRATRRRNPHHIDFGDYHLVDPATNGLVTNGDLRDIAEFLKPQSVEYNDAFNQALVDAAASHRLARAMKYVRGIPKAIPAGQVLVHNVRWSGQVVMGLDGFRAWLTTPDPEHQDPCDCEWTTLPHFRTHHE